MTFFPSQSHSASLRFNYTDYERTSSFKDEESLKQEEVNSIIGSWVAVVGQKGINDFRFQYLTDDLNRGNLRVGEPIEALIRFRFGAQDQVGKFDFLPIVANTTTTELRESFSYLFGKHDLKFGLNYVSDNMQQIFAGSKDGRYDFGSLDEFLANEDFRVRIYFGDVGFPNYDETQDVWAFFAQDAWKPDASLGRSTTASAGVRPTNPSGLPHVFPQGARTFPMTPTSPPDRLRLPN